MMMKISRSFIYESVNLLEIYPVKRKIRRFRRFKRFRYLKDCIEKD